MQKTTAKELLTKYQSGNCTEEEIAIVESWYLQLQNDEEGLSPELLEKAVNRVFFKLPIKTPIVKQFNLWYRVAVAASIIFCVSVGGYFIVKNKKDQQVANIKKYDIPPATSKAILTLANGAKIVLNNSIIGKIASQGNTNVVKLSNGLIGYDIINQQADAELYNTMTTPKGGLYSLTLSDGTKVWLNAASSITYPVTFKGKNRDVTTTGEVYFEVEKNKDKPFRVQSGNQTVEVLGTHFNINSYNDEAAIVTTLLEGRVKVTKGSATAFLDPGEQAVSASSNNVIPVNDANIDEVMAWKNGIFNFNKADIKTVMRQFARWYDVDVEYNGVLPKTLFTGEVHRDLPASKVLEILDYFEVQYSVEQTRGTRKIIIAP